MPLRLRIVSDHRLRLGERSSISIGLSGGSIGRAAENDWVLPDPQRYVSSRHARIVHRQDRYFLEDVSSNGTFLNDDTVPVSRRGAVALKSGDLIRLGEYAVMVAIDADSPEDVLAPSRIDALLAVPVAGQTDLGASLNLEALLPDTGASDSFRPVNAFGQAIGHALSVDTEADLASAPHEVGALRRQTRLAQLRARQATPRPSGAPEDAAAGLQAFCRGAGLDPQRLPADAQARLLHLSGLLLREALVGLKDLDRAQESAATRLESVIPPDSEDPRPSLRHLSIEDLLVAVLSQHESQRLDALQWIRDQVEAAKLHERAWEEAMRGAFLEFIRELDPGELETRFKQGSWDLYRTFYRSLTEMSGDRLPHRFLESFGTLYRAARARPKER